MGFVDYFVAEDAYLALAKVQGGLAKGSILGDTYWLDNSDSDAADVGGRGKINAPFATIQYAIDTCTDANYDVILVKPGHDETIEDDDEFQFATKSDTSVVGITQGARRPIFRMATATDASVNIDDDHIRLENLHFEVGIANLAKVIDYATGAGCQVIDCLFTVATAATDYAAATISGTSGVDGLFLRNRICYGGVTNASATAIAFTSNARGQVIGNDIVGAFTTAVIDSSGAAAADLVIVHNRLVNTDTVTPGKIFLEHTDDTGVITDNRGMVGASQALATTVFSGAGDTAKCENYFSNEVVEAGAICPTSRST